MTDDLNVRVNSYGPDRPLSLVFVDPLSGKKKAKSAGTRDWREAERLAGELEKELRSGRYAPPSKVTWAEFRSRYKAEHLASLRPKTAASCGYALDAVERHLNPDRLVKLTPAALATFQAKLRATGIREASIASTLRHVRAALGWAVAVGMLPTMPKIIMPKAAKGRKMKGGALVGEQFDRLVDAVEKVRPDDAPAWKRYLKGVWLSGLRLAESLALSWDEDAPFAVDLSGRHPRLRIRGEAQKSGRDEVLPLTPDFGDFLLETPPEDRHGPVFVLTSAYTSQRLCTAAVGKIVALIGEKAGVVVNRTTGSDGKEKVRYATLHDLRRSFATRWARRVSSATLRRLMRHASVTTTEAFYVDMDADELAADLWARHAPADSNTSGAGNTFGNNRPKPVASEGTQAIASAVHATGCDSDGDSGRGTGSRFYIGK